MSQKQDTPQIIVDTSALRKELTQFKTEVRNLMKEAVTPKPKPKSLNESTGKTVDYREKLIEAIKARKHIEYSEGVTTRKQMLEAIGAVSGGSAIPEIWAAETERLHVYPNSKFLSVPGLVNWKDDITGERAKPLYAKSIYFAPCKLNALNVVSKNSQKLLLEPQSVLNVRSIMCSHGKFEMHICENKGSLIRNSANAIENIFTLGDGETKRKYVVENVNCITKTRSYYALYLVKLVLSAVRSEKLQSVSNSMRKMVNCIRENKNTSWTTKKILFSFVNNVIGHYIPLWNILKSVWFWLSGFPRPELRETRLTCLPSTRL